MIKLSKPLAILTKLLLLLAFAKAISLGVWLYLPSDGVELSLKESYQPKYQRVNFSNMIQSTHEKQKKLQFRWARNIHWYP